MVRPTSVFGSGSGHAEVEIREVWADNLMLELAAIRLLIGDFPIVAMDAEFPGGDERLPFSDPDASYNRMRAAVDRHHLVQLGLALADGSGRIAAGRVWQFNFHELDPSSYDGNPGSLDYLSAAGVNFAAQRARGVCAFQFAEQLVASGAVLNDDVSWVTFNGAYDAAYLLKCLTAGQPLPPTRQGFGLLCSAFFPRLYDLRILTRYCLTKPLYCGLDSLANLLGIARVGRFQPAGSDALLALRCYLALMRNRRFAELKETYNGVLRGLGNEATAKQQPVKQ